jgi:hypothetical protein
MSKPKQKYTLPTKYYGNGAMPDCSIGQYIYFVYFSEINKRYEVSFRQAFSFVRENLGNKIVFDEQKFALKECYKKNRELIEAALKYENNLRDGDIAHFF